MFFSKENQLILRHKNVFKNKKIFFSGNIEGNLPINILSIKTINFKKHHLYISQKEINNFNTLVYYWPKNKCEARFQLFHLFSLFSIGTTIFIVGKKSSGVKSVQLMLNKWIRLKKIDNAKHSILFFGILLKNTSFQLQQFFNTHIWNGLHIKSLPGVFGYKKIDEGSKLLASTFSKKIYRRILDVGSGSGFLSASILKNSPESSITMIDNKESAIISSKNTLKCNNFNAEVIFSDVYSHVFKKYDLIISNPPFHNDLKVDFNIIKNMIINSKKYLNKHGELRFVTNSCWNYSFILKKIFKKYCIIEKNNQYQVYQAY